MCRGRARVLVTCSHRHRQRGHTAVRVPSRGFGEMTANGASRPRVARAFWAPLPPWPTAAGTRVEGQYTTTESVPCPPPRTRGRVSRTHRQSRQWVAKQLLTDKVIRPGRGEALILPLVGAQSIAKRLLVRSGASVSRLVDDAVAHRSDTWRERIGRWSETTSIRHRWQKWPAHAEVGGWCGAGRIVFLSATDRLWP